MTTEAETKPRTRKIPDIRFAYLPGELKTFIEENLKEEFTLEILFEAEELKFVKFDYEATSMDDFMKFYELIKMCEARTVYAYYTPDGVMFFDVLPSKIKRLISSKKYCRSTAKINKEILAEAIAVGMHEHIPEIPPPGSPIPEDLEIDFEIK